MQAVKELTLDPAALIFTLTEGVTVSGMEKLGHEHIRKTIEPYFDECKADATGNLLFIKKSGKRGAKKLMLDAHLDEIGMLVTEIKDGGFLKVTRIGGIDTRIMFASEVWIYGSKRIPGIVVSTPPHLQNPGESSKLPDVTELLIDTGYSREELEEIVELGTPVGFKCECEHLLGSQIVGKGFDDKSCAAIAVCVADRLRDEKLPCDVCFSFTTCEEISSLGAATLAYSLDPDWAIVLDVTHGLAPDAVKTRCGKIGGGAAISYSAVTDRPFTDKLVAYAEKNKLPYQTLVETMNTGTNGNDINIAREGIPTAVVSLPLKNMHTSGEIIDCADVVSISELIAGFILEGLK